MIYQGNDVAELKELVVSLELTDEEIVIIFLGNESKIKPEELHLALSNCSITFLGCVMPAVINSDGYFPDGILIKKFKSSIKPIIIEESSFDKQLVPFDDYNQNGTVLLLMDFANKRKQELLFDIYNKLLFDVNVVGGCFGSSVTSLEENILFTNSGVYSNASGLIWLDHKSKAVAKHGIKKMYGPLIANKNEYPKIKQFNWRNAKEVYLSIVAKDKEIETLNEDELTDLARLYPIGIYKEDTQDILREMYFVKDEIHSVVEIDDDTVVNIMSFNEDDVLEAVSQAVRESLELDKGAEIDEVFIIDCISRSEVLGKNYKKALDLIEDELKSKDLYFEGILSMGEISSYQNGMLEFYNKTIISTAFYND